MDNKAFAKQMDRIIDAFGPENYSQERLKLIYKECQELTNEELERLVDHMIKTIPYRYPPLPNRFVEEIHAILGARLKRDVYVATQKIDKRSGLKEALEKLGAKSLVDAIKRVKD